MDSVHPPSVLEKLEIPPIESNFDSSTVVVFLYGLGDGPGGIPLEVVDSICVLGLGQVRWVLPAAYAHPPVMAVTGNMQKRMSSWFDICIFDFPLTIPPPGKEDDAGILKSIAFIDALLTEIVQSGVDPSCIVLGGISQGAAMNLLTGLTTAKKLAGLIVLSARLPLRHKFKSMVSAHASSIPIFWGHGNADPLVSYKLSRVCVEYLVTEIGVLRAPCPGALKDWTFTPITGWPTIFGTTN